MRPPLYSWLSWLRHERDAYAVFVADEVCAGYAPLDRFVFGYERARWRVEALRQMPPLPVEIAERREGRAA